MSKLVILCGYSGAGKDYYETALIKRNPEFIQKAISYTTRPMRPGEEEGKQYFFTTNERVAKISEEDILTSRTYYTIEEGQDAVWNYVLTKENALDGNTNTYKTAIIDHQGTKNIIGKIGRENVFVIYLKIDDDTLLARSAARADEEAEFERRLNDDKEKFKGIEELADFIIETRQEDFEINMEFIERHLGLR